MLYISNVTKNQAYRLYLAADYTKDSVGDGIYPDGQPNLTGASYILSKDDGEITGTTNKGVFIDKGFFYIDLTAEEMNADKIVLYIFRETSRFIASAIITTAPALTASDVWSYADREITGGGLSLTDVVNDVEILANSNPTLGDLLSFLWQSIRKKSNKDKWPLAKFLR